MSQHPAVRTKSSGSHLDQHPSVGAKGTGSKFAQNPNVKKGKSGSHLDQHPNVLTGNSSGSHLEPSVKAGKSPRTVERGGHSREGHVRQRPATNTKAGGKFVPSRGC